MKFEQFHRLHDEPLTPMVGAPLALADTQPSVAEETTTGLFGATASKEQDAFGFRANPLFLQGDSDD